MGIKQFIEEDDGVGTVEVVLLLVVIVALVVIFRKQIKGIVDKAMTKVNQDSESVINGSDR
ncbi:MAG: Flp1 family type IVb pilin [Lachnospiraceae bacterium]|nr:Flp1 family type IVb pilin [Lachnospiraceae bacterium]